MEVVLQVGERTFPLHRATGKPCTRAVHNRVDGWYYNKPFNDAGVFVDNWILCPDDEVDPVGLVYPDGEIREAVLSSQIKYKWVEIVCDLVSPEKGGAYRTLPNFQALHAFWRPWMQERWRRVLRPRDTYTHDDLWDDLLSRGGNWVDDMGPDHRGDVPLVETWLWSEWERTHRFQVVMDDDPSVCEKDESRFGLPKYRIDYAARLPEATGLDAPTIAQIRDKGTDFHPRRNKLVPRGTVTEINRG